MNAPEPQPLREPVRFGERYWLTELLAVGGMAEIYLARQNAMAGFEKDVVIKRLKPELAKDARIAQMFLDEARIGALLNHPNIVHVYDVDEQGGVPYIAMELIVGEQLNALARRGLTLGKFLPLPHAVELMRQAASGMGYFHHKRAAERGALEIVHCDISPTNLLVTEDGFMKVIDFGIARSTLQSFREEGVMPGKLSYMAPEQAAREAVDHRTDIFALGVVLYEITVGKRLFKGPAQDVVRRLTACDIQPPTFVRRSFPGALEAIIMRCLERHPDDRYQSAYDLADALQDFLIECSERSGPVRIARYLDELAQAAGGQRRPELISESELAQDDEDLDFEREMFDGYIPTQELDLAVANEWDDVEESDESVASALGIDVDTLHVMRTPVPVFDSDGAPEPASARDDRDRDRDDSGDGDEADDGDSDAGHRAGGKADDGDDSGDDTGGAGAGGAGTGGGATRSKAAARDRGGRPRRATSEPAARSRAPSPAAAVVAGPPGPGLLPWLALGGLAGVAALGTVLYFMLT